MTGARPGQSRTSVIDIVRAEAERLGADPLFQEARGASVLITGAGGMVGSYLALAFLFADKLHGLGLTVHGLSRDMAKAAGIYAGLPLVAISRDVADLPADLPRFDYVVHAASPVGPSVFASRPFEVAKANLAGVVNLLEKALRDRARRFLFVSTHEVYGRGKSVWREDDLGGIDFLSPRACYPEAKRAGENACVCAASQYGLHINIARPSRLVGPNMNLDSGLFVCDFLRDAMAGRPVAITGDPGLVRPLCYAADAVSGLIKILFAGGRGAAYNIAPAEAPTILETAEEVAALAGVDVIRAGASGRGGGAVQDAERLRRLGWRSETSWREALSKTFAALRGANREA